MFIFGNNVLTFYNSHNFWIVFLSAKIAVHKQGSGRLWLTDQRLSKMFFFHGPLPSNYASIQSPESKTYICIQTPELLNKKQ